MKKNLEELTFLKDIRQEFDYDLFFGNHRHFYIAEMKNLKENDYIKFAKIWTWYYPYEHKSFINKHWDKIPTMISTIKQIIEEENI